MWPKKRQKRRAILAALGPVGAGQCLELGCRDGRPGLALSAQGGAWFHVEREHACALASARLLPGRVVQAETPLPFRCAAFDVIVLSDLLEHVADEGALLAEVVRCLAPGGRLLLTAPLDRPGPLKRWSRALGLTEAAFGHRRPGYSLGELRRLLIGAGLEVTATAALGGLVDEFLELAANALFARLPGRSCSSHPAVPEGDDWRGWRGVVGRLTGWVVGLVALFDGWAALSVPATAVICATKPSDRSGGACPSVTALPGAQDAD